MVFTGFFNFLEIWGVSFISRDKVQYTLGPAQNEQSDAHKCARSSQVHVVTEFFNIVVSEKAPAGNKLFARSTRVFVVTELVVSGTQCNTITQGLDYIHDKEMTTYLLASTVDNTKSSDTVHHALGLDADALLVFPGVVVLARWDVDVGASAREF